MLLGHMLNGGQREMYRVEVKESMFCFSVTKLLFEYWCSLFTNQEFLSGFLAIRREEGDSLVTFFVDLPVITYPNCLHKHLDRKALLLCVKKISLLLEIFNWLFPKEVEFNNQDERRFSGLFISEDPQLVLIETSYIPERQWHACPIEVGYDDHICELLAKTFTKNTKILLCEEAAFTLYYSLSTERKRDFEKAKKEFEKYRGESMDFIVRVREMGVPQFIVPGNCACLGENPDSFKSDRGMSSHNLDTPLAQLTMLTAVVSFWNDVLRPLYASHKEQEGVNLL